MSLSFDDILINSEQTLDTEILSEFRSSLEVSLNVRRENLALETESNTWKGFDCSNDLYEFKQHLEEQSEIINEVGGLANELCIVALYKMLEIKMKSLVTHYLNNVDETKLFNVAELKKVLPFKLENIEEYSAYDEIRLINNAIKHEGVVSEKLADKDQRKWIKGNKLQDLDKEFKRLEPRVKVFFYNFAVTIRSSTI